MSPSHEDLEKVYKAVVYIEKSKILSLKAYPRTITSFLRGSELSPYFSIYQKYPDVCGSLKKCDLVQITFLCDQLANDGFFAKRRKGDKILYVTTKNDFLSKRTGAANRPSSDSFYDKISPSQKLIVDAFVEHFSKDWTGIDCLDFKSYYGFKAAHSSLVPNPNWFWLALPEGATNCLQVKVRMSPKNSVVGFNWCFNSSKTDLVLSKIDSILSCQTREFHLAYSSNRPLHRSLPTETAQTPAPKKSIECKFDYFDMREMCRRGLDFYINNGTSDSTEALLSTGESSPFSFLETTVFAPKDEMKDLVKGAKSFDFAIRKWKLVAWSTLPGRPDAVQDVLLLGKKTKCTWFLIHLPNRSVTAFTKYGFYLNLTNRKVYSVDFMKLV
jgi:hypothetical protein